MQKGSDTCKPWSWPFPGHLRDEPTVATSPGKWSLRPHKQSSVCIGQTWIWRRPESTPWEVSEWVQLHKCVTWYSQSGLTFPSLIMIIRGNKEVCGRRHWVCGAGHGTTLRPEAWGLGPGTRSHVAARLCCHRVLVTPQGVTGGWMGL